MTKDELLKCIAETGYNVGFGAKKHFSTYDIVEKTPGWISFISMAFGIYALVFDSLSTKFLSSSFAVLGVAGLYISLYDNKKASYKETAVKLIQLFNELEKLYRHAKTADDAGLKSIEIELVKVENEYYQHSISKQITLSDWYAHYKFFWQHQIDWIDEQKKFRFFRDKIPLSLSILLFLMLFSAFMYCFKVNIDICRCF